MHFRRTRWEGDGPLTGPAGADSTPEPVAARPAPDRAYEHPVVTDKGPLADLTWAAFTALDKGFRPRLDG